MKVQRLFTDIKTILKKDLKKGMHYMINFTEDTGILDLRTQK